MASGSVSLQLAEDAADTLAEIERRAEAETSNALKASLAAMLLLLRPALMRYREAATAPGSVSAGELAARYQDILRIAQRFLTDGELQGWERQYRRHVEDALAAGARSAELQQRAADGGVVLPPYVGPDPQVVNGYVQVAGQGLRAEAAGFRVQLAAMVGVAAMRGWGQRRVEAEARRAIVGVPSREGGGRSPGGRGPGGGGRGPGGGGGRPSAADRRPQTGIVQRVVVNTLSTLQRAFQHASDQLYRAAGVECVRWVATRDERTCAYCVARHGRIYRRDEVMVPAHRRCRCILQPVDCDAVNDPDEAARDQRLDGPFWRRSQQLIWREYALRRGRSMSEARPELLRAATTPTAEERWRLPGTRDTARPLRTLDGPGGRDLGTAVRDSNRRNRE